MQGVDIVSALGCLVKPKIFNMEQGSQFTSTGGCVQDLFLRGLRELPPLF